MTQIAAFTAGVLMVLAIYGGQCAETDYISNPEEEKDIYNKCVNILKECERRWVRSSPTPTWYPHSVLVGGTLQADCGEVFIFD